jgi:hypothetical protein
MVALTLYPSIEVVVSTVTTTGTVKGPVGGAEGLTKMSFR